MASPIHQGGFLSSSTHQLDYDVFLNFRGEDTRNGFTGNLYCALCFNGFKTFIDDDLPRGKQIPMELLKAIKSSSISIIIFSQNYAFSTWCLDELVEILICKQNGQLVLPIFYKVNPSEVCKQEGNFKVALAKQENKFKNNIERVQMWRAALNEAALLSGWHYKDSIPEYKFIQQIIEYISHTKLNGRQLNVAKYLVEVNFHAKITELHLHIKESDVQMEGIHGLGGIGKPTIAKAICNRIVEQFEGRFFLENVRENSRTNDGTIEPQKKLPDSLLKVESVAHGTSLRKRLPSEKALACSLLNGTIEPQKKLLDSLLKVESVAHGTSLRKRLPSEKVLACSLLNGTIEPQKKLPDSLLKVESVAHGTNSLRKRPPSEKVLACSLLNAK